MNAICIHATILSILGALLIFHVLWFKYMLCGDEWNKLCYGRAEFLTFKGKDISEEKCGSIPNRYHHCYRGLWYYFESESKEIMFSNVYNGTEHCGWVGSSREEVGTIYAYDLTNHLVIGKQYAIYGACKQDYKVRMLIPLSKGGFYDIFESGTVPTRSDHDFCIAMFIICSLTIIIYLSILIPCLIINKQTFYQLAIQPGFAGHAI